MLSTAALPPGGEGQVQVTVDTLHRVGPLHKVVSVYSDDPVRPVVQLEITGEVKPRGAAVGGPAAPGSR